MATSEWLLLIIVAGIFLDVGFRPVQAGADPYLDRYLESLRQAQHGFEDFEKLMADKGLDFGSAVKVMGDNEKMARVRTLKVDVVSGGVDYFMLEKLSAVRDMGTIQERENGDRLYVFESEDPGQPERQVVSTCVNDLLRFFADVLQGVEYASRMWTSRGKIPDNAAYTGELHDPGNIWLCQSVKANATSQVPSFNGRHCYAIVYPVLGLGSCVPDTCTEADVNALSWLIMLLIGVEPFYYVDCTEPTQWSTADIGFTAALAFFAFLVLCGSFYEIFLQELVLGRMHQPVVDNNIQELSQKVVENDHGMAGDSTEVGDNVSDIATTSVDSDFASEAVDAGHVEMVEEKAGAKVNGGYEFEVEKKSPAYKTNVEVEFGDSGKPSRRPKKASAFAWAILHAIMMSFSAVNNCKKLLSAKKTKNTLAVLNGLRVISMFWVILGHSCQFYIGRLQNPIEFYELSQNLGFFAVSNGTLSVDTFFVLSGFLVTYLTLKQIDSVRKRSSAQWAGFWSLFYFHRWWRLTPVYMAAMGINALLLPHFGVGYGVDGAYDWVKSICRRQWWTHPLYINNLYPWQISFEESCMGWAWYLANDMQFYVISPLILIVLYKNCRAGMILLTSIMLVSLSALFGISWHYGFAINTQGSYNDNEPNPPGADTTYTKPYTRIPTYLVGMVVGYILFMAKGKKLKMPFLMVIAGWLAAAVTLWFTLYGVWFSSQRTDVPQATAVIYLTFHRVAWGTAIGWIIFACMQGLGGPIDAILSWKIWIPLARLTYCAYLIHPVILFSKIYSDAVVFHMTYMTISYLFVANLVFSYAAALILSLLIEGPTMGLEKVMFGKFKRS